MASGLQVGQALVVFAHQFWVSEVYQTKIAVSVPEIWGGYIIKTDMT